MGSEPKAKISMRSEPGQKGGRKDKKGDVARIYNCPTTPMNYDTCRSALCPPIRVLSPYLGSVSASANECVGLKQTGHR